MKLAQRVLSTALIVTAAACANTGGLGNILGGVLAPQAQSVGATVQTVDTRSQTISLTQGNGQNLAVTYDNRTKVVYQNQLYPVTSLEYGDQVVARLLDNGNNGYYTDSITVTYPVNGSPNNGGTSSSNGTVQSLQGTVRNIDRSAGWFTIDSGNGVTLTVTLPYRASSQDINRFNNLRIGDYVRFGGTFVNNNRVELVQFY